MSNAIRDVTIRAKIEQAPFVAQNANFDPFISAINQVEERIRGLGNIEILSQAKAQEQAAGFQSIAAAVQQADASLKAVAANDPFANLDASVQKMKGSLQEQAASLNLVEQAATRNFQAMLNQAQAEGAAEQATRQATMAQRAQSVEHIMGTGNALRAAAASGSLSGAVASLGQALVFTARGAAQQSAGNVAVATTAAAAGAASEYQATALGHVSMVGARAATANAGLAAANAAVAATGGLAARSMTMLSASLGPIAIGVAVVSLAVQLGGDAWAWWAKKSRTANDDVKDAVKQRLDAEKQSAAIEAGIQQEEIRRRGSVLELIDRQTEALQRYRSVQQQLAEVRQNSFEGRLALNADDPNTQLAMLRKQRFTEREDAVRGSGRDLGIRFGNGQDVISSQDLAAKAREQASRRIQAGGGQNDLDAEKQRLTFLQDSLSLQDRIKTREEQRAAALRQNLQTEIQSRDVLKDRLKTIQDQIAAEQGRLQSAAERFAQMDPGEQARLKSVAAKSKAGGELTLQEAQLLSQSGVGQGQAGQAFERIANKAGFQQVAGNLGEFNQIQQLQFQGQGVSEQVKESEARIRKNGEEIQKSMATLGTLLDVTEEISASVAKFSDRVDKLERTFGDSKAKGRT